MSKENDNTNKPLKDLLNSKKGSADIPMDDFDKEALEGFETLENDAEAFELKSKLDSRIYEQVFEAEKKQKNNYWYAAAGLIFIIGFSVFLMNRDGIVENNNLALETKKTLESDDKLQKNVQEENLIEPAKADASVETLNNKSILNKTKKDLTERKEEENKNRLSDEETFVASSGASMAAPMQASKNKEPEQPIQVNEREGLFDKESMANVEDQVNLHDASAQDQIEKVVVKKSRKKPNLKRADAPVNEAPEASSKDVTFSAQSNTKNCFYPGGEEILKKDLSLGLIQLQLLKQFDVILFINASGKVQKTSFTNSYSLSQNELNQIEGVLKELEPFQFLKAIGKDSLEEYTLYFRP